MAYAVTASITATAGGGVRDAVCGEPVSVVLTVDASGSSVGVHVMSIEPFWAPASGVTHHVCGDPGKPIILSPPTAVAAGATATFAWECCVLGPDKAAPYDIGAVAHCTRDDTGVKVDVPVSATSEFSITTRNTGAPHS